MNATTIHPDHLLSISAIQNTSSGFNSLANYITPAPTVYSTQTCKETLRVLFSYPESKCIVVIDQNHHPVGLVMNNRFYLQMMSSTSIEGLYSKSITKMMSHSSLVVDIHSTIRSLQEELYKLPGVKQSDCVIVTEHNKLVGVINVPEHGLLSNQLM